MTGPERPKAIGSVRIGWVGPRANNKWTRLIQVATIISLKSYAGIMWTTKGHFDVNVLTGKWTRKLSM